MNRTLDVAGYYRLPRRVRDAVDAWLEAEGIGKQVFDITLTCAGIVTIGRYRINDQGKRFYDHRMGRPAQEHILVAVRTAPPPEAF
jgi:hypothetical protein